MEATQKKSPWSMTIKDMHCPLQEQGSNCRAPWSNLFNNLAGVRCAPYFDSQKPIPVIGHRSSFHSLEVGEVSLPGPPEMVDARRVPEIHVEQAVPEL